MYEIHDLIVYNISVYEIYDIVVYGMIVYNIIVYEIYKLLCIHRGVHKCMDCSVLRIPS